MLMILEMNMCPITITHLNFMKHQRNWGYVFQFPHWNMITNPILQNLDEIEVVSVELSTRSSSISV
jgi:hypothetical protein